MTSRAEFRSRLEEVLGSLPNLRELFSSLDPYSPVFRTEFEVAVNVAVAPYWHALESSFPDMSGEVLLRHAWALAEASPVHAAVLIRSVALADSIDVVDASKHLHRICAPDLQGDQVARAILSVGDAYPPDLGEATLLMPGMRLRYALASRLTKDLTARDVVAVSVSVQGASTYVRRRELLRLLRVARERLIKIAPYDETQFVMASPAEQGLILTSSELVSALLPPSISRRARLRPWLERRILHRDSVRNAAPQLFQSLEDRDFTTVEQGLRVLNLDAVARFVLKEEAAKRKRPLGDSLGPVLAESLTAKGRTKQLRRWVPISQAGMSKLKSAFPRRKFPDHWLLGPNELAAELKAARIKASSIREIERRLLDVTWSQAERQSLIESGVHQIFDADSGVWPALPLESLWAMRGHRKDFLDLLKRRISRGVTGPELLPFLAKAQDQKLTEQIHFWLGGRYDEDGFAASVISHAGTEDWRAAGGWAIHGQKAGMHLRLLANSRVELADLKAFCSELAQYFQKNQHQGSQGSSKKIRRGRSIDAEHESAQEIASALCARFPGMLELLVSAMQAEWLKDLIPLLPKLSLLNYLQSRVPKELVADVFTARVRSTKDPRRLCVLLVEGARKGWPIPWSESWRTFADVTTESSDPATIDASCLQRLTVLVLALRRDAKRLKRLTSDVPEGLMRRALSEASILLRGTKGKDAVLMELAALVGLGTLPHLASAMSSVDHGKAPGHRVDHCYHQWELPKKSGGTRTISAPERSLRKTQRALLEGVLDPLAVHRCAYGFVKGLSIKHNAAVHVGQQVVVNVDVSNCFPSVRWQLVWGALRRDLSNRLSPGAIGTVVDLCTAQGGLPIGAPTSPALLNRVLFRTDELLEEAARIRGCRYSRYADDISFSGDHGAVELIGVAKGILSRIGLSLDAKKTNIFRRGRRQICTGLVVNVKVSVPRRIRRRLRAAVHEESLGRTSTWHGQPQSLISLKGRIAFLSVAHPSEAAKLLEILPKDRFDSEMEKT